MVDLALLLDTSDFHFGDRRPEFDSLTSHLSLVIFGHLACYLAQLLDVAAQHVVLLASYLNETLHGRLPDRHVPRLQRLLDHFVHDVVALGLVLEVCCCVGDAEEKSFDCKATRLHVAVLFAYVLCQSHHYVVLQLLSQIFRTQLFADESDRREGSQADLLILVLSVLTQIRDELAPLSPRDFRLGNGCDQTGDLVAHGRGFSGKAAHARLFHVLSEDGLKLEPQVLVARVLSFRQHRIWL